MDAVRLLKHVVDDLSDRIGEDPWDRRTDLNDDDEYSLLQCSGLLRLLLADDRALLTTVSSACRMKPPTFRIRSVLHRAPDGSLRPPMRMGTGGTGIKGIGIYGLAPHPDAKVMTIYLPDFLAAPVASTSTGQLITTKTAIKVAAHAFGGVHFIPPDRLTDRSKDGQAQQRAFANFLLDDLHSTSLATIVADLAHVTVATGRMVLARATQ